MMGRAAGSKGDAASTRYLTRALLEAVGGSGSVTGRPRRWRLGEARVAAIDVGAARLPEQGIWDAGVPYFAKFSVEPPIDAGALTGEMIAICGGGLLIVFALWWLYFDEPEHASLNSFRRAFTWGYGHYLVSPQRPRWAPGSRW